MIRTAVYMNGYAGKIVMSLEDTFRMLMVKLMAKNSTLVFENLGVNFRFDRKLFLCAKQQKTVEI